LIVDHGKRAGRISWLHWRKEPKAKPKLSAFLPIIAQILHDDKSAPNKRTPVSLLTREAESDEGASETSWPRIDKNGATAANSARSDNDGSGTDSVGESG
jgi:hypothetical protein